MKSTSQAPIVLMLSLPLLVAIGDTFAASRSATLMAEAAERFLASLTVEQRSAASFPFEDEQRFDWHYIPRARTGVPLKELRAEQRKLAHDLLRSGVSQNGYLKVTTIIQLETILRELERRPIRDPELYFFTIFGPPSSKQPWGWRAEGHHLSLNFTIVGGTAVAVAPSFFGANPAEVRQGPHRGLRALRAEEDLARDFMRSLDQRQLAQALFDTTAPNDMVTANARQVDPLRLAGIPATDLKPAQMALLQKVLEEYLSRMPPDLAAERSEKLRRAGLGTISFGWAGGVERGQPHYYRIQGKTFLIEYDNTQNDANHIHTVWRDFDGDFGRDLLREHYRSMAHPH